MNIARISAGICRWTARIVGTLLVLVMLVISIGEGLPNPLTQPTWAQVIFLGLALIMIGILLGWRLELTGGNITLAGFCVGFVPLYNSDRGMTWFYIALALPGVLYIVSAVLRRYTENRKST